MSDIRLNILVPFSLCVDTVFHDSHSSVQDPDFYIWLLVNMMTDWSLLLPNELGTVEQLSISETFKSTLGTTKTLLLNAVHKYLGGGSLPPECLVLKACTITPVVTRILSV